MDVQAFPAFYAFSEIQRAKERGFYVVVRPINHPLRRLEPGLPLVPKESDAVVFQGLEALGHPYQLEAAKALVPVPVASSREPPSRASRPSGSGVSSGFSACVTSGNSP